MRGKSRSVRVLGTLGCLLPTKYSISLEDTFHGYILPHDD
mgnify:CR=1 FL=1